MARAQTFPRNFDPDAGAMQWRQIVAQGGSSADPAGERVLENNSTVRVLEDGVTVRVLEGN